MKTLDECKTKRVLEKYDSKIRYKPALAALVLLTVAAPYVGGPIIRMNQKRFTHWGWLPDYEEVIEGIPMKKI